MREVVTRPRLFELSRSCLLNELHLYMTFSPTMMLVKPVTPEANCMPFYKIKAAEVPPFSRAEYAPFLAGLLLSHHQVLTIMVA